ncbi:MAG: hypothetical protein JEY71_03795 [Sphaerochaeta sp.]|nr:hypothetical protein [Sphaerochaeta sp.]
MPSKASEYRQFFNVVAIFTKPGNRFYVFIQKIGIGKIPLRSFSFGRDWFLIILSLLRLQLCISGSVCMILAIGYPA